jgi:hypothetical protein
MGVKNCRELVAIQYGSELESRIRETDVTVGTTVVQLCVLDGARIWLSIQNAGAATIYVSTLNTLAVNQGFVVPAGGFLFFNWKDDLEFPTLPLWAISGSAGNNVHVVRQILTGSGF